MAADEHGISPRAKDGVPDPEQVKADQLALARARKQAESDAEAAAAMGGRAIDDQPEPDEPSEDELFPMGSIEGDHAVTMKNIVPAAKARKTEAKMRARRIALRGGLVRYGELLELVVTVEAGKVEEVPDLEEPESGGRRKLLGVKDVQHFRPVHVTSAAGMYTLDQVLEILEREFAIPRTADKVREVFGLTDPPAAAAG